jgi:glutathione synthase/RimK-type ligase-like ATP-grasp enzyme
MRVALLLDESWETAPRVREVFLEAGHEPTVNPSLSRLRGFDVGMMRANHWKRGSADLFRRARRLEALGTPLFNSVRAIANCADKVVSGRLFERAGLATPASWLLGPGDPIPRSDRGWVIKPRVGSQQRAVEVFSAAAGAQRYLATCRNKQLVQERLMGPCWRVIATPETALRTYAIPVDARGITDLPDGEERGAVHDPDSTLEQFAVLMVRALGGTMLGVDVIEDASGAYWALEANAGFGFNIGDHAVEHGMLVAAEARARGHERRSSVVSG